MDSEYINQVTLRGEMIACSAIEGSEGDRGRGFLITLRVKDYEFSIIYYGKFNFESCINKYVVTYVVVYGSLTYHRGAMVVLASRINGGEG